MKKEVQNCMTWLVSMLSESDAVGDSWSDEYKIKKNKEAFEKFREELKKRIDFSNLTVDEAVELRFRQWKEKDLNIWLVPLYLLPILPDGLELFNIFGIKSLVGKDHIDNDIRFGCIAYGIVIKEENKIE